MCLGPGVNVGDGPDPRKLKWDSSEQGPTSMQPRSRMALVGHVPCAASGRLGAWSYTCDTASGHRFISRLNFQQMCAALSLSLSFKVKGTENCYGFLH